MTCAGCRVVMDTPPKQKRGCGSVIRSSLSCRVSFSHRVLQLNSLARCKQLSAGCAEAVHRPNRITFRAARLISLDLPGCR